MNEKTIAILMYAFFAITATVVAALLIATIIDPALTDWLINPNHDAHIIPTI